MLAAGRPPAPRGAEGQNRTGDTSIFSAVLYLLSYLGAILCYVAPFQSVKNDCPAGWRIQPAQAGFASLSAP